MLPPAPNDDLAEFLEYMFASSPLPSLDRSKAYHYAIARGQSFKSGAMSGKWCIFAAPDQIDAAWAAIKKASEDGRLLCAKASTAYGRGFRPAHLICVYTRSWEDREELLAARAVLRELGFADELGYKRDIDTLNGVYNCPEEWYLRA